MSEVGGVIWRNEMPLTTIQVIKIFCCWGIDFMGPFPQSFGYRYLSKWVEVIPAQNNGHRVVDSWTSGGHCQGIDQGMHFFNWPFEAWLRSMGSLRRCPRPTKCRQMVKPSLPIGRSSKFGERRFILVERTGHICWLMTYGLAIFRCDTNHTNNVIKPDTKSENKPKLFQVRWKPRPVA